MGLLDDAIREHLELKRLRGADPGAVAREEKAALGPMIRESQVDDAHESSETQISPAIEGAIADDADEAVVRASSAGQETVEINMDAELAAGADSTYEPAITPPERTGPGAADPARDSSEDSLEWEMPSDRPKDFVEGGAEDAKIDRRTGDERLAAERGEDLLEETPDFLRDTPEQERLWFEQRPPRDFDFNE